ncbi:GNAT family N-acetyltransferase [Microtetraspora sp. NBRC 16547]|uniref:GNAT family N-acetyltransferase n=1 Tax=Microtetraspora sp. NBRC 16547 TaxID=3030993 RepID=UPI002555FC91|nr:GNAT family N-acetyltransferase [Microtetraspora sp. NBRC 16547]
MVELLAPAPAGVRLLSLHATSDLQRADRLLRRTWGTQPGDDAPLALDMMCALAHTGGYVGGAFLDDELVGVAAGFLAAGGTLHSHIAGVAREAQGRGVGLALKRHQRAWAAERGLTAITWTFDPLVRRNAYFNLTRLGATAVEYLPDFYGPLSDGINDGDVSDRLFVTWPVAAPPPGAASPPGADAGAVAAKTADGLTAAVPILDEAGAVHEAGGAPSLRCATPPDVERLREDDPGAARHWRAALGAALGGALADGYLITGFTRSGWYLLARGGAA